MSTKQLLSTKIKEVNIQLGHLMQSVTGSAANSSVKWASCTDCVDEIKPALKVEPSWAHLEEPNVFRTTTLHCVLLGQTVQNCMVPQSSMPQFHSISQIILSRSCRSLKAAGVLPVVLAAAFWYFCKFAYISERFSQVTVEVLITVADFKPHRTLL